MARRRRFALVAAVASVAAAVIIWVVAFRTTAGARADASTLADILDMRGPRSHDAATTLVKLGDPGPVALFTAAIIALALVRRRFRLAVVAGVVLAGANVTTQVLKSSIAEQRPVGSPAGAHIALESWPSGHATAATTLALCLVAVAPSRLRPLAAVAGSITAFGVACSVLVLGWHLPSDVLGGFCVAAAWTLGAVALADTDSMASIR